MQGAKFKQFQAEGGPVVLHREGRSCARRDMLAWHRLVLICRTRHAQMDQQRAHKGRTKQNTAIQASKPVWMQQQQQTSQTWRAHTRFLLCFAFLLCAALRGTPRHPPPRGTHMKQNRLMVQTTAPFCRSPVAVFVPKGVESPKASGCVGTHTAVCSVVTASSSDPPSSAGITAAYLSLHRSCRSSGFVSAWLLAR